jgi:hypothetical protein
MDLPPDVFNQRPCVFGSEVLLSRNFGGRQGRRARLCAEADAK